METESAEVTEAEVSGSGSALGRRADWCGPLVPDGKSGDDGGDSAVDSRDSGSAGDGKSPELEDPSPKYPHHDAGPEMVLPRGG